MARPIALEDFGSAPQPPFAPLSSSENGGNDLNDPHLEERRLEAYEEGYKAGWDDATQSENENQKRISADFSQNLQDLSFTSHEARTQILGSLEPLFKEMVHKILPQAAQLTLGLHIIERVTEMADGIVSHPLEIVVSPQNSAALSSLIGEKCPLPHTIVEEPSLAEGQVYLRFGEREEKIDLNAVLTGMEAAISAFTNETNKVEIHG